MPKADDTGTTDTGLSDVTEPQSAEEIAADSAFDALINDDGGGEEIDDRQGEESDEGDAATDPFNDEEPESDESGEQEEQDDSTEVEEESSDEADESQATDSAAERKRYNEEMARARVAERKAREEAEQLRKERQESNIQRYLDEAEDDEVERERRQVNVEQFRLQEERVQLNTDRLQNGLERALGSIDLFRTGSNAAKEELLASVDDFEQKYIQKDKHDRILQIGIDPSTGKQADIVAYLQRKADSIKRLQGEGASQQVRQKSNERARTMTPPGKVPRKPKTDEQLEAFFEEARRP